MKKKLKSKKYEFIPVNKPLIEKKDITEILRSLKRGWISSDGPEVKSFEKNFSKLINRKYSTAVSNGTAALEIAIKALDIKTDKKLFKIYEKEKKYYESKKVYFAGRLAEYKYINTDQAVEIGMNLAKKILKKLNINSY